MEIAIPQICAMAVIIAVTMIVAATELVLGPAASQFHEERLRCQLTTKHVLRLWPALEMIVLGVNCVRLEFVPQGEYQCLSIRPFLIQRTLSASATLLPAFASRFQEMPRMMETLECPVSMAIATTVFAVEQTVPVTTPTLAN